MSGGTTGEVRFGPFRLTGRKGPLLDGDREIPLRGKALDVLWHLATRSGDPMGKEALIDAIWNGRVVSDASLAVCIHAIRQALGDDPRVPRYVKTVHRYGYRFVHDGGSAPPARRSPALVGRDAAQAALDSALSEAAEGGRRIAYITGIAGIGKSALLRAWAERQTAGLAIGRCLDRNGTEEAYLPFLECLAQLCDGPDGDTFIAAMRRHAPLWLLQFPKLLDDQNIEDVRARTLGADSARMRREFADLLAAMSETKPLVLILEDIHWSDASSLELLNSLAHRQDNSQLLIVASLRPDDGRSDLAALNRALGASRLCLDVSLDPLDEADVTSFLRRRLGADPDRVLSQSVFHRSGGHPLFMVSLADHVALSGCDPAALDSSVPADLVTFIAHRLDALSRQKRAVVDAASVTGASFTVAELEAAIAPADPGMEVEEICEALARSNEFLRLIDVIRWPDGTLSATYGFVHELYRDVVRDRVSPARKALFHGRIAARLEAGFGSRADEIAIDLATHYEAAREPDRAVHYLDLASQAALSRHAYREAASLLHRALALIGTQPPSDARLAQELELLLALGPVLISRDGYAAASVERVFDRARQLSASSAGSDRRLFVLRGLGGLQIIRANFDDAEELGHEVLGLDHTDAGHRVEGHLLCGMAHFFRGHLAEADAEFARSHLAFDRNLHGDHAVIHGLDPATLALGYRTLLSVLMGHPEYARAQADAVLAAAEASGHPHSLCQGRAFLAMAYQWMEDVEQTERHSELAIEIAAIHGFSYICACERFRSGWLRLRAGDIQSGSERISEGLANYSDTGATGGATAILATLVEAHVLAQDSAQARTTLTEALSIVERTGERFCEPELLRLDAVVTALEGGPRHEMDRKFETALSRARQQGANHWIARIAESKAVQ